MAPLRTTIGQLLVNEILPPDLRDYGRVLDKKGVKALLTQVQARYPDQYREITSKMLDIGGDVAHHEGSSIRLADLKSADIKKSAIGALKAKIEKITSNRSTSHEEKDQEILMETAKVFDHLQKDVYDESMAQGNNIAKWAHSGGRGNASQLNQMRGAALIVMDHHGKPISIPMTSSFSEGMDPVEYWAASYGVRSGYVALKGATPKAGFLGKQLSNANHRLIVVPNAPLSGTGLPVDTNDPDNEGAVLAKDYDDFKAGTILTPKILKVLADRHDQIVIHSPIASPVAGGGIPRLAAGVRERDGLSPIGDNIGIAAAQALCLDEATLVKMANGEEKAIKDIVPGEFVLGCSTSGHVKPVKVLDCYCSGIKTCCQYEFRAGTAGATRESNLMVIATPEHKILSEVVVRTNKAAAIRLDYFEPVATRPLGYQIKNDHDRFCAKLSSSFDDAGCRHEPFACLLGALTGDGCYTGNGGATGVTLACFDPVQLDDLSEMYRPFSVSFTKGTEGNYRVVDEQHHDRKFRDDGSFYGNRIIELLKTEGMWGNYSWEKKLPKSIYSWDNASVAQYIAGYLATDGFVSKKGFIGFSSTSYALLVEVRKLVGIRFGAWGTSLHISKKKKLKTGEYRNCYSFIIAKKADVKRLQKIMVIPGVKQDRLVHQAEVIGERTGNMPGRCSLVSSTVVGERTTYDLYVAHPDHLFLLANGLVVSNSEKLSQATISCLSEGTLVRMADLTVKPIEDIQVGDKVLGSDTGGTLSEVLVTRTYDHGLQPCRSYNFGRTGIEAGYKLVCTDRHRVLCRSGVLEIGVSAPVYGICLTDESAGTAVASLIGVSSVGDVHVYDIEVDHPDHLFLLANGMIVSNSKHVAGVKGAGGKGSSSESQGAYEQVNKLVNIPQHYEGQAAVATLDGSVGKIEDAPQGGQYVVVGGKRHYVPPHLEVNVKVGDTMEAGDVLSSGIPSPAEVVQHKGIGEGRRYLMETMGKTLRSSGIAANRRNLELISRGLINHVRVTGMGVNGSMPDDILEYDDFAARYTPREGAKAVKPHLAKNQYIEQPVLHYSIGTRITPRVTETLKRHGVDEVMAHAEPPAFEPEMQRGIDTMSRDPDWMVRLGGFHLGRNFLDAVHRGAKSKLHSTSYIPSLAQGQEFARSDQPAGY